MTPAQFFAALSPAAKASELITRIPAAFTLAEGALESAWGSSRLATEGKNLFGVKADASWHGDTLSIPTREFLNGQWVIINAKWRKYPDWQGCMQDHGAFLLTNHRYAPALAVCSDVIAFTRAIAKAGYATDPAYADKIISIINKYSLNPPRK